MKRPRGRALTILVTVVGMLLGGLLTAGEASATREVPSFYKTAVPASGKVSCYGYYGTFKAGTYVVVFDWVTSSDECFGIATDRTIWHAWPNSGGWHRMGGNGHADEIYPEWSLEDTVTKQRQVAVFVYSSYTAYCQDYALPNGWTGSWFNCS